MLMQKVKIISYNKETNTCVGENQYGEKFDIDPFVGCAIFMDDAEYLADKGFEAVGKTYVMSMYSVYASNVVPHEGGFHLIG